MTEPALVEVILWSIYGVVAFILLYEGAKDQKKDN